MFHLRDISSNLRAAAHVHVLHVCMSLYLEAASFIDGTVPSDGSIRSRVYAHRNLKSNPGTVYALLSEAARWSSILSPIIEGADILKLERRVSKPYNACRACPSRSS